MIKCKICGKMVTQRRNFTTKGNPERTSETSGVYTVVHINPETKDVCHGFFVEGIKVKVM